MRDKRGNSIFIGDFLIFDEPSNGTLSTGRIYLFDGVISTPTGMCISVRNHAGNIVPGAWEPNMFIKYVIPVSFKYTPSSVQNKKPFPVERIVKSIIELINSKPRSPTASELTDVIKNELNKSP